MTTADLPIIAILVPLLVLSGLWSASETALLGLTYNDRTRLSRRNPVAARAVARLLSRPRRLLVSILILNMAVNVLYFVVSSVLVKRVEGAGWVAGVGAGTLLGVIVFGELLPKLVASAHRVWMCGWLAPPVELAVRAVTPVRVILEYCAVGPLARLIAPHGDRDVRRITTEELSALLEAGARGGALDAREHHLLAEVVELGVGRVRDVMTPRLDVEWIDMDGGHEAVMKLTHARHRRHAPVVRGTPDRGVVGMLDLVSYMRARARTPEAPPAIADHMHPAVFVPGSARLDHLLARFSASHSDTAVCVDEFGAVTGLVDLESLVKELVTPPGELSEEHDVGVQALGPGRWRVPGRLSVRDWAEVIRIEGATDRRVSTVAGLVMLHLRRVPKVGDTVDVRGVRLEVAEMSGPVIRAINVTALDAGEAAP